MVVLSLVRSIFLIGILPLLVAVVARHVLFRNVPVPPSDYGTGSMFDSIAGRYDFTNRVLAMGMDIGWRKVMVDKIRQHILDTTKDKDIGILDVATGTADVAILLAQAMPQAHVVGVDPSANMLDIGRTKIKEQNLYPQIQLRLHDAQQDFGSAIEGVRFDAATMSFGIRNVADRELALCNIHRMLQPNARFCILEFSEPEDTGFLSLFAKYFIRHAIPILGGVVSGQPREYWHLQNSIQDFPSPQQFVQLVETLDCTNDASSSRRPAFRLEELVQLNFGSVQLYVFTALHADTTPTQEKPDESAIRSET